jgi:hypothetical protein
MELRKIIRYILLFALITTNCLLIAKSNSNSDPKFQKKIEVPFDYNNGLIQLNVKLNGIPLVFIYDTGAEHSILTNKEIAVILNLKILKEIDVFGADLLKKMTAYITEPINIELFKTKVIKQYFEPENAKKIRFSEDNYIEKTEEVEFFNKSEPILILEKDIFSKEIFSGVVSGILGASYFNNMMVEIDYKKEKLYLYPYNVLPKMKSYKEIPAKFNGNKPIINTILKINEKNDTTSANLLLDTGCSIPLMLLENIDSKYKLPDKKVQGQIGIGLGGDINGWIGLTNEMKIEEFSFGNLITKFQDTDSFALTKSSFVRDGLIGNEILDRFTVLIDNINKKVYLKPNKDQKKTFKYDKSGLTLFASGKDLNEIYVKYVIPGSPADIAGIKPEDRIIRIQGFSSKLWNMYRLTNLLRKKENKLIKLKIKRDNKKIDFRFRLQDMFL